MALLLAWASQAQAGTATFTTAGTTNWVAPTGVTSVVVEVWGGGGAGGGNPTGSDGGGGGGGGGYSKSTITVISGNSYSLTVGAAGTGVAGGTGGAGGDSFFINATTVMAKAGTGGAAPVGGNGGVAGAGGASASGVGTAKFSGGAGGTGRENGTGRGGAGGSSAGTGANGLNAVAATNTASLIAQPGPTGSGIGGNGGGTGANGSAPASGNGGGGGGSGDVATRTGGDGAPGKVVINYGPTVTSINLAGASPTTANPVSWTVTFSESVLNVVAARFAVVNTGLGGTPAVTGVAGSGTTWTVTASTGTGTGTLGLNLTSIGTITDLSGNALSASLPVVGQVYTIVAVNCTSNATGVWSASATWDLCRNGIPLAGDAVTILGAHTVTLNATTPVLGNLTNGGTLTASGTNTLNIGGSFTNTGTTTLGSTVVNLYGDFTNNNGTNFNLGTAETGTWNFLGAALQNINSSGINTTFPRLVLNNTSGIAMNASSTIKTLLTLTNGYISTGTNILIMSANCNAPSWQRTNGFVAGNVRLTFPTGTTTCTFPVGSGSTYAPIGMTMVASAGGTLTGSTTGEEHPQIATSGIDANGHDVNRYWSLWATGDTVSVTSYGATFNFVSGDLDATATAGNFVIGMYASGAWTLPTPVTAGATSTSVSNVPGPITVTTGFAAGEKVFVCSTPSDLPSNMTCQCDNFSRASVNPSTIFGGDFALTQSSGTAGWPKIANGHLQMTNNSGNMSTSATVPGTFPAAGNLVSVEFLHYAYQNGGGVIGADGIGVTLSDSAVTPLAGAYGGSLGYAQKTAAGGASDINGFAGGWIGVGIDEYGNFSNPTEGRVGPVGGAQIAESVAVRGSGSLLIGYPFLGGTAALNPVIDNTSSATPARGHAYRVQVDARCYQNNTANYTGNFALNCATANPTAARWARVRVYRDTTGAGNFGAPLTNLDFEAYAAATAVGKIQADVPATWRLSYTGSTGASLNYHEIDNLKICAQTITPPAGYRIQVDNLTPSTCGTPGGTPSSPIVTVTALDTNGNPVITYNKTVTLSAPLSSGGASSAVWSLKTGAGTFIAPNQYTFVAADLGVAQFYLTDASPQSVTVGVSENGGTISSSLAPPPIVYAGGSFTIANIDTLAAAPGGGVVAGRPHKMSITRSNGCTTDTTYRGAKNLDGWYTPTTGDHPTGAAAPDLCATNSSGTCLPTAGACQTLSISPPTVNPASNNMPTLTFGTAAPGSPPNGVAYFCLVTSDVGKYSVSLRDDSAASVVGSSGTLTARPFAVVVSGVTGNPAGTNDMSTVFTSAGSPFQATVGGYLWSSSADTGANGLPGNVDFGTTTAAGLASHYADTVTLAADTSAAGNFAPVAPPATRGSLTGGGVAVTGGSGSSSTLAYSEVGSFTLKATPASSYLNSGVDLGPRVAIFSNPASASQNKWVGRFKPHHFTLSGTLTNRGAAACAPASSFTYLDEGLDLTFTLTAVGEGGGVTTNYVGFYAKLVPTLFSNYAVGVSSGTTNLTPRMSGAVIGTPAWAGGMLSAAVARVAVAARSVSPSPLLDGPWTSTQFGMAPIDSDGTQLPATALNLDVDNNAAFDHQTVGATTATTELRFGRLRLSNAYGSELLDLPIPVQTQFWNGTAFVTNSDDNCTTVASSSIGLSNYQKSLNSGETGVSPATVSFASGIGSIKFTKPGAGNSGSVDLCVDLGPDPGGGTVCSATSANLPFLQGKWPPGTSWDNDPTARATFGIYKSPLIYRRENY